MAKGELPWRVGRQVGRTIYDAEDTLIGVMDTPELAATVVDSVAFVDVLRRQTGATR